MTDRLPALTYHITLSHQGVYVRCPTPGCGVDDAWSPESMPGSDALDFYLCLACQQYRVDARYVKDRVVTNPEVDQLLAVHGDFIREAYASLRVKLNAAGMDEDVKQLDEWWGDSR